MPCTLLVMESENVSVRHFDFDNSLCLNQNSSSSSSSSSFPRYLSASIVSMASHLEMRNIYLEDLRNQAAGILLYLAGRSSGAPTSAQNVSLIDFHDQEVLIEMLSGEVAFDDSVHLSSFCLNCSSPNNVENHLGPIAMSLLLEGSKQQPLVHHEDQLLIIICTFLLTACIVLTVTSFSFSWGEVCESKKDISSISL